MDTLKEKPGLVAIGLAAVATAGFVLYKSVTGNKDGAADAESAFSEADQQQTSPEVELENSFFLDAEKSWSANESAITKWMNDQVESLLSQNEDRKLDVRDRKLSEEDFLRFMLILQGRQAVMTQELKKTKDDARLALLKKDGVDSIEYLKQLIADVREVCGVQADAIQEVCDLLKVANWVVEESQDVHVGNSDNVTGLYVRKFLDLFLFNPYSNSVEKSATEAAQIHADVMTKASERIGKPDTLGLFETPEEFLYCYNALCVDIARSAH